jgi:metacaspase-1
MRKKALLIGICYFGTSSQLNGCINDVENMKNFLISNGYKNEDITVITDNTTVKPTRKVIINSILELLLTGAERLFIHYSGHGSYETDLNGDEVDKKDEALVPLDYHREGLITDDQLRGLLTFMNPNSHLTVIFDCCHSGSGLDLAYSMEQTNIVKRKLFKKIYQSQWIIKNNGTKYVNTPGQVILISGCKDPQVSFDDFITGKYQGALTFCLLECLKKDPNTWVDLIDNIRTMLKEKSYSQIACLSSGKQLLLDSKLDFC